MENSAEHSSDRWSFSCGKGKLCHWQGSTWYLKLPFFLSDCRYRLSACMCSIQFKDAKELPMVDCCCRQWLPFLKTASQNRRHIRLISANRLIHLGRLRRSGTNYSKPMTSTFQVDTPKSQVQLSCINEAIETENLDRPEYFWAIQSIILPFKRMTPRFKVSDFLFKQHTSIQSIKSQFKVSDFHSKHTFVSTLCEIGSTCRLSHLAVPETFFRRRLFHWS